MTFCQVEDHVQTVHLAVKNHVGDCNLIDKQLGGLKNFAFGNILINLYVFIDLNLIFTV